MQARLVLSSDFDAFDYIVCMDTNNLRDVRSLLSEEQGGHQKLFTFMELLPDQGIADVPDPYYDGNFTFVYELVENGCKELLKRVQADMSLS